MFEASNAGAPPSGSLSRFSAAHVFRPDWRDGAAPPAVAALLALVLGIALIVRGFLRGVSFASFAGDVDAFLLLLLAALFAYWAYGVYNLRYAVDDDALTIAWGGTRQVIPIEQVQRIVLGRRQGRPRMNGLSWRGCHIGRGFVERFGEVQFYSAHRTLGDLVYVMTPTATFGISLTDARGLARTISAAQERGRGASTRQVTFQRSPLQSFFGDVRSVATVGVILLVFVVAAGYIAFRYQGLPLHLSFSYPPGYGPEHTGDRSELMRIPLTALLWLLVGVGVGVWTHAKVRAVSYLVLLGTLFAECLYATAAITAVH